MKATAHSQSLPLEAFGSWPDNGALNVAAIYQEFAAGIRLQEALIALGRSLGLVRVTHKAWSFGMLERLDVRSAAIREAASADVLIVVASGDQALPSQIIRWLERCLVESSGGPVALVELHDDVLDREQLPLPLSTEMTNIASRWQMELVTNRQFDDWLNADNIQRIVRQP